MKHGIDVSYSNGVIDWAKVKASGLVDFAIIRASYGWDNPRQIDKQLNNNIAGCEAVGIHYGFYHYSYAENATDAVKEADFFLNAIANSHPTYPLVLDIEEARIVNKLSANTLVGISTAFLNRIEEKGHYATWYTMASLANGKLKADTMNKYDLWVAHWNVAKPNVTRNYGMWQYATSGSIPGISGNVDLDVAYKDYPSLITKTKTQEKTEETIDWQVKYNELAEQIKDWCSKLL